jgi:hypothetical protein
MSRSEKAVPGGISSTSKVMIARGATSQNQFVELLHRGRMGCGLGRMWKELSCREH